MTGGFSVLPSSRRALSYWDSFFGSPPDGGVEPVRPSICREGGVVPLVSLPLTASVASLRLRLNSRIPFPNEAPISGKPLGAEEQETDDQNDR